MMVMVGMEDTFALGLLIAFVAGWFISQLFKLVSSLIAGEVKNSLRGVLGAMFASGGMPSGHTASLIALATYALFYDGFTPFLVFIVAMSMIVMYDAVKVRYSVGRQAEIMNEIIEAGKFGVSRVKVVRGHTLLEVIGGIFLGICVGALTFTLLNWETAWGI